MFDHFCNGFLWGLLVGTCIIVLVAAGMVYSIDTTIRAEQAITYEYGGDVNV